MFSYLKNVWYEEEAQTPTIESLLELCKGGEVKRVIIPNTYYGYGATLIDDSNRRSIKRHYRKSRFIDMHYSLTMSASQFIRNADYRELVEDLAEREPIFNDTDYSDLETETKLEFLVDELAYAIEDMTKEEIGEVLETRPTYLPNGEWLDDNIDWWEYVEIDSDGATPYATKEDIEMLAALVKARAVNIED
jgi:hypothetical protein